MVLRGFEIPLTIRPVSKPIPTESPQPRKKGLQKGPKRVQFRGGLPGGPGGSQGPEMSKYPLLRVLLRGGPAKYTDSKPKVR